MQYALNEGVQRNDWSISDAEMRLLSDAQRVLKANCIKNYYLNPSTLEKSVALDPLEMAYLSQVMEEFSAIVGREQAAYERRVHKKAEEDGLPRIESNLQLDFLQKIIGAIELVSFMAWGQSQRAVIIDLLDNYYTGQWDPAYSRQRSIGGSIGVSAGGSVVSANANLNAAYILLNLIDDEGCPGFFEGGQISVDASVAAGFKTEHAKLSAALKVSVAAARGPYVEWQSSKEFSDNQFDTLIDKHRHMLRRNEKVFLTRLDMLAKAVGKPNPRLKENYWWKLIRGEIAEPTELASLNTKRQFNNHQAPNVGQLLTSLSLQRATTARRPLTDTPAQLYPNALAADGGAPEFVSVDSYAAPAGLSFDGTRTTFSGQVNIGANASVISYVGAGGFLDASFADTTITLYRRLTPVSILTRRVGEGPEFFGESLAYEACRQKCMADLEDITAPFRDAVVDSLNFADKKPAPLPDSATFDQKRVAEAAAQYKPLALISLKNLDRNNARKNIEAFISALAAEHDHFTKINAAAERGDIKAKLMLTEFTKRYDGAATREQYLQKLVLLIGWSCNQLQLLDPIEPLTADALLQKIKAFEDKVTNSNFTFNLKELKNYSYYLDTYDFKVTDQLYTLGFTSFGTLQIDAAKLAGTTEAIGGTVNADMKVSLLIREREHFNIFRGGKFVDLTFQGSAGFKATNQTGEDISRFLAEKGVAIPKEQIFQAMEGVNLGHQRGVTVQVRFHRPALRGLPFKWTFTRVTINQQSNFGISAAIPTGAINATVGMNLSDSQTNLYEEIYSGSTAYYFLLRYTHDLTIGRVDKRKKVEVRNRETGQFESWKNGEFGKIADNAYWQKLKLEQRESLKTFFYILALEKTLSAIFDEQDPTERERLIDELRKQVANSKKHRQRNPRLITLQTAADKIAGCIGTDYAEAKREFSKKVANTDSLLRELKLTRQACLVTSDDVKKFEDCYQNARDFASRLPTGESEGERYTQTLASLEDAFATLAPNWDRRKGNPANFNQVGIERQSALAKAASRIGEIARSFVHA